MKNKDILKTGIPGLDEIFEGGIRRSNSILVSGCPGTGKTIFSIQFLYEGAKMGEPGLYITTEEKASEIKSYANSLGLNLEKFEKKGLIFFCENLFRDSVKLISLETPLKTIKTKNIKRVILDGLTLFEYLYSDNINEYRRGILRFLSQVKQTNATLLATSERSNLDFNNISYKPEDFLFNGLIFLAAVRKGYSFERVLTVVKMRGQKHSINLYPFSIGHGGIKIHTKQIPFSLEKEF